MERYRGYYRVFVHLSWRIAYWNGTFWTICGAAHQFEDHHLTQIDTVRIEEDPREVIPDIPAELAQYPVMEEDAIDFDAKRPLLRALEMLNRTQKVYGLTATQFAWMMWPSSEKWSEVINHRRGVGLVLSAGGYLNRLLKEEYVINQITPSGHSTWRLSEKGSQKLKELTTNITV
jgi:hypothetical protein